MRLFQRHYLDTEGFPVEKKRSKWLTFLYWGLIIVGLFLVQTNVVPFGLSLNLTVLVPFYVGLRKSPERGMAMGIVVGLIEDSLSNVLIGPHMLSKGLIGLMAPLLSGRFFIWTPLFGIVALFFMSFLDGIIVYGCRSIFLIPPASLKSAVVFIFFQSLVNSPAGYFIRPRDE